MKPDEVKRELIIPYILISLLIWGAIIALGAYVFRGQHDYRKPLIILACVGTFVGFWGLLLWFNRGRIMRGNRTRDDQLK
jgi:hypothetical protein